MSIPALNWAIAQRLKPTRKLVLLALAHRQHQKTTQCNPSLSTLIADTGLSRSAIKTALRHLEKLKLLRVISRKATGRDLSNQYELLLENAASGKRKGARADLQGGREPSAAPGPRIRGPVSSGTAAAIYHLTNGLPTLAAEGLFSGRTRGR